MKQEQVEEHVYCTLRAELKQVPPALPLPQPRYKPCPLSETYENLETQRVPPLPPKHWPDPEPHHKPHPPPTVSEKIALERRDGGKSPIIMERGGALPLPQARYKPCPLSETYETLETQRAPPLPPKHRPDPEPHHKPHPSPTVSEKIALERRDGGKSPIIMERGGALPLPQARYKPCPLSETYENLETQRVPPLPPKHRPDPEPHHKQHPPPTVSEKIALEWRDGGKSPIIMERGGALPLPQAHYKPCSLSETYENLETQEVPPLPPKHRPDPEPHHKQHPPPTISKKIALEWRDGEKSPIIMERGGAVSNENIVYFVSTGGESYSFSMITGKWSNLPKCPYGYSSLAIIYGHLTTIGGCTFDNYEPQNKLVSSLGDKGWVEYFPPMPTKRWKSAAVCTELYLVVAGGKKTTLQLKTVEVMDIKNIQWSTVASLPHPYSEASAAICGDVIYMLGGFDDAGKTKSVLACSLTELLQCHDRSTRVWSRVTDVPTTRSTCAAVGGHLLAIGGMDAQNRKASAIYEYNTATGSWDLISNMPTPQYNRLVAVLLTNEIIVVGGCTRFKTDTVDIAKASISM